MEEFDFNKIEKKWQEKWEKEGIFEAEPDKRPKFFLNFPYPYINAYQHIGHLFTLMRVEAFARYKRLKGFNVLFPQGWHATGSPIVNAAKRVKDREPKQIKIMKDMGISEKEFHKFEKPEYWIEFFEPEFRNDYKSIGMSVDWRREFHTTSLNPHYNAFVQWQFRKLKEKNYVIRGEFPVVWDPVQKTAVGDHDRIQGEGVVPQEFLLVKHKLEPHKFLVSATLRPDTILGITNLYVHPEISYAEVQVGKEIWIVSENCVGKLREQNFEVKVGKKINGKELIGKETEEIDGRKVLVLPATFLDPHFGTGLVHSVPSDSADDLMALRDLQKDEKTIAKFKLDLKEVKAIEPIGVLETPGFGDVPAQKMIEKYKIINQNQREQLEKIKEELYKLSFYSATYNEKYKSFFSKNLTGKKVAEGKELIKEEIIERNWGAKFYALPEKVVSRALNECVVKIVDDQWFVDYGNEEWKKEVRECLAQVKLYPEKSRQQFQYVVDWLHEWACTREEGLGTRLPWDEKWLIESLSDSTIYMAYYTISHLIKELDIDEVSDELFDYVLLGRGKGKKEWKKMREAFEYWYPVDFRNSGKDLIQNHLTFFLFNHVAIFPKDKWPKGIGVNGWVTVDGQKMSKSLGNMIPVREVVKKYGADSCRITILNGGEGMDDPNWDTTFAESIKGKLFSTFETIKENYGKGRKNINHVDELYLSRSHSLLKEILPLMEETQFRSAIHKIFFVYWKLVRDYLNDTNGEVNSKIFSEMVENYLIMLSPFCPHFCEEVWHRIGKKEFILLAKWPESDSSKINQQLEQTASAVDTTVSDVMNILKIMKEKKNIEGERIFVYVLPKELAFYDSSVLSKRAGKEVKAFAVNDPKKHDPEGKSSKAKPGKPAIYVE